MECFVVELKPHYHQVPFLSFFWSFQLHLLQFSAVGGGYSVVMATCQLRNNKYSLEMKVKRSGTLVYVFLGDLLPVFLQRTNAVSSSLWKHKEHD